MAKVAYYSSVQERYEREHHQFLKESNPTFLEQLTQSGKLKEHLRDVSEDAAEMHSQMMRELTQRDRDQKLTTQEQLRKLPGHLQATQESVRHDLIHQPLPEQQKLA